MKRASSWVETVAPYAISSGWAIRPIGMVIGQSLVLYALGEGDAGITTILSSTTPVLLLPALWVITRKPPALGAWIGAGLSVLGTSLLI